MANYSSYKVAQSNGNFTAAIWNGFFSAVGEYYSEIAQSYSFATAMGLTVDVKVNFSNGDTLSASEWNTTMDVLHTALQAIYDDADEADNTIQGKIDAISALKGKASGATISNQVWNDLVQNVQDILTYVVSTQSWKFGQAMPIVLS